MGVAHEATKSFVIELPKILSGRNPRYARIRNKFYSVFAYHLYEYIHRAFQVKTRGGIDDLGESWAELDPKTIKNKRRNRKDRPRSKHPTWRNYDTGRMRLSITPGYAGSTYRPKTSDQIFELVPGKLILGTRVEWLERMESYGRALWPSRIDDWIAKALDEATKAIMPLIRDEAPFLSRFLPPRG